jgi:peptide/nickel transport system substrate-binding protein
VDHLTITFHLKRAYAPFLQFWVNGFAAPLPAHHFEKMAPKAILKSPDLLNPQVTSGPFLMKGSVPGDHYTLARNPRFYRASKGLPYLNRVVFRIRDDQDTILKDLQAGSITSAHPLDYSKLAEYRRLSNYMLIPALTSSSFEALFLNFHNRVLSTRPEVRLAMAEAIDHKALIAGLPQGHGVPQCTDHGSFYHPGYQPQPDCPVFDSAAANKLLDDKGWVRGSDGVRARQGQRLDFEYVTTLVTAPWRTAIGALIQRNLKEIGIKLDVQYYPLRKAYEVVVVGKASPPTGAVAGGYDIVEANEYLPGYDPDDSSVLGCGSFLPKGGNVSFYCNPTLEALYKQEQETTDAGVRQQIFNQIHEIYLTEFPIIVLYGWIEFTIARKGTHNHQASALDGETTFNIWEWWCDQGNC